METIENNVLAVLSTLKIDGNTVRITGQLDRKLYLAVNKVLDRIGGKWNRKAKAHVFDDDPTDRLNNVIECGMLDPKVKTGYFPTPREIVDKMIELAMPLKREFVVLEPSAGQGHISDALVNLPFEQRGMVVVCENLPENINVLKEKGYSPIDEFFNHFKMCDHTNTRYDRILMNPPFERQSDIDHATAAYHLLAPNGVLVAIMSGGVTFRKNKKTVEFREKILEPCCTHLEHLPDGSFKESGTMAHTIMLRLEK